MSKLIVGSLEGYAANDNTVSLSSGHKLYVPGTVVQTQMVVSSPTRYAITAQDISAIPELEINFTPKFQNSKIIISAMINGQSSYVTTYGFLKNNSYIISNTNTNSAGSISTVYDGAGAGTDYMYNQYIDYVDTATSFATINYKAAVSSSWGGTVYTTYINDRPSNDMRSVSSMKVMEIAQ